MAKKNPPENFDLEDCSKEERMKYEVAMELGLYDQIMEQGWKSLSSKEAGKIGGIVANLRKESIETN